MKQVEHEIKNLNTLADFIEANPKEYDQLDIWKCIVGLGLRLRGEKARSLEWAENNLWQDETCEGTFAKKFGVSLGVVDDLFIGQFNNINPKVKNRLTYEDVKTSPKVAAGILRFLAKQKGLDK